MMTHCSTRCCLTSTCPCAYSVTNQDRFLLGQPAGMGDTLQFSACERELEIYKTVLNSELSSAISEI